MIRFFLILAIIWPFKMYAQLDLQPGTSWDKLSISLVQFFKLYPQEKAFIVTDNTAYLLGESIWYKIYLWSQSSELLSNTAYVVIRDISGVVAIKHHILLINGEGHGDFSLPDSLQPGIYSIEVFSHWMMNFSNKPVASRLIWISDGKQPLTNYHATLSNPVVLPEGGSLQEGMENKVAICPGNFTAGGFSFEVFDATGKSIYRKFFKSFFGIANVNIQSTGTHRAQICLPSLNKCYDTALVTNKPSLKLLGNIDKRVQLKIVTPVGDKNRYKVFACTDQHFLRLEVLSDTHSNVLTFDIEEYPRGLIYFVLVNDEGEILSSRTIFNTKNPEKRLLIQLESQPVTETLTKVNMTMKALSKIPHNEKLCVLIQPENVVAGSFYIDSERIRDKEYSVNDMMLFQEFYLGESISRFLKTSSLSVKYSGSSKHDVSNGLDFHKYQINPIDLLLGGLNTPEKIDLSISYKKDLRRIKETYGYNVSFDREKIPSDETYSPKDYPSINNTIEFLAAAIPKLKVRKIGDQHTMTFFYTNLKGQKGLYDADPSVVINGFKVGKGFLKELPISEIQSIGLLYNSKTIIQSNLNSLFPYGVISIYLKEGSAITKKIEKEYPLFSHPYEWPHNFSIKEEFSNRSARLPLFSSPIFWNASLALGKKNTIASGSFNEIPFVAFAFSLEEIKHSNYIEIKMN